MTPLVQWSIPATPWLIMVKRYLPDFDLIAFAKKHNLDQQMLLQEIASGLFTYKETLEALSKETDLTQEFLTNLNNQYVRHANFD